MRGASAASQEVQSIHPCMAEPHPVPARRRVPHTRLRVGERRPSACTSQRRSFTTGRAEASAWHVSSTEPSEARAPHGRGSGHPPYGGCSKLEPSTDAWGPSFTSGEHLHIS